MRVHISLAVEDIDRSREFYENMFGHPATKVRDDYLNFVLDEPPIFLSLLKVEASSSKEAPKHILEFGIELPDIKTLDRWRDRLTASSTTFHEQAEAECCYATGEKLWLMDPDDYPWEIWVHTGDVDHLDDTNREAIDYRTPGSASRSSV